MKRLILACLIAIALAGSYYLLSRPETVSVTEVEVERGLAERTAANTRAGTVEACRRSRLSLPTGGQIDEIHVAEGEHVSPGQLLVSLWNQDARARVSEAEAASVYAGRERERACITARSDRREAERIAGLVDRELVSAESADLAQARADASAAACEAAKAREHQAGATVELAQSAVAKTELRAPFEGIIAEVTGELGEYATPSPPGVPTPPMIDLITDDCHYISAPIDEVDAADIAVDMPVRVSLDAYRGQWLPARVSRIAPYVLDQEKQARTVEVEARLTELPNDVRLLVGYSADMEIILESREQVLRVPSELILDNRFVLVVGENGVIEERDIEPGIANWRFTEVVSGLTEGERIIANVGTRGVVAGAHARVE